MRTPILALLIRHAQLFVVFRIVLGYQQGPWQPIVYDYYHIDLGELGGKRDYGVPSQPHYHHGYPEGFGGHHVAMPRDIIVDVINDLGIKLLAIHNEHNENNIAISPYGAFSVLAALTEGLEGDAAHEILHAAHIPKDKQIIRVGLRDIHRHLKSYFIPQEGFLAGLTLNLNNVTLRSEYEDVLHFYGFDFSSFNNALYPEPPTTKKPIEGSTLETGLAISQGTTLISSPREEPTTTDALPKLSEAAPSSQKALESTTVTVATTQVPTTVTQQLSTQTTAQTEITTMSTEATTAAPTPKELLETSRTSAEKSQPTESTTTESANGITQEISVASTTETIATSTKAPQTTTIPPETTAKLETTPTTTSVATTTETPSSSTPFATTTVAETPPAPETTIPPETTAKLETTPTTSVATTTEIPFSSTPFATTTVAETPKTTTSATPTTIMGGDNTLRTTREARTQLTTLPTTEASVTTTIEIQTVETAETEFTTMVPIGTMVPLVQTEFENDEGQGIETTEFPIGTTPEFEDTANVPQNLDFNYNYDANNVPPMYDENIVGANAMQNIPPEGASFNNNFKRHARSIVDYVIARFYDDHHQEAAEPQRPQFVEQEPSTFAVYGKYRQPGVNFMKYDTVLPYFFVKNLNALALSFPLDSTKYYLLLLLPLRDDGVDQLICDLRLHGNLRYIIDNLRLTHVVATIPSFMLKGYVILTPTLQTLGIRKIFEPRQADFSPMTNVTDIYVTNIEQAVTVTIRNYLDPSAQRYKNFRQYSPVNFKADHPFLYFVMDSELHVALMVGKVINPLNSRIR